MRGGSLDLSILHGGSWLYRFRLVDLVSTGEGGGEGE